MLTNDKLKGVRPSGGLSLGTGGDDVTVVEKGSGELYHTTVISFNRVAAAEPTEAASLGGSVALYTFPTGRCLVTHAYMDVSYDGSVNIVDDTPEVGLGMTAASGAIAVLSGTASLESVMTAQVAPGLDASETEETTAPITASVSIESDDTNRTLYLNVADGWAGAGTCYVSGEVIIHWTAL